MQHVVLATAGSGRVIRRAVAMLSAGLMVAAGLVMASPAAPAQAVDGSQFDAGNIITDAKFYDANAMTEAQIQSFLTAKIGTCQNSRCLNVLTQNTYSRPQDRTVCAAYVGADAEPVSRVIYKVQKACGISAKVLLVTLQKEMGLVTSKAPSQWALNHAMGYGCPDSSPCDSDQAGFYNQVYKAAWQFKRYSTPDVWGGYWAGQSRTILYSPNSNCAPNGKWVTIKNRATAALYAYTPYTPTAAALAAFPAAAAGDDAVCGSYGNRNFWFFYYDWFGSPTDIHPIGVETPRIGGTNRFDTAVQISAANFDETTDTVYIANGLGYADALSAAPAAALQNAPLLLVQPKSIPSAVADEIQRLTPSLIVVVGGTGAVSEAVYDQLATMTTNIRRDGGGSRYATSRTIAQSAFTEGSDVAYIATGATFPDALSASAAAGTKDAPVILVDGSSDQLDPETLALLASLKVTTVFIAGGTAAVSAGLEAALAAVPGVTTVTRFAGGGRYETSALVNQDAFPTGSSTIYIASGRDYPDALAGAVVAGLKKAPLYLAAPTCLYPDVLEDIVEHGTTNMVILGGTGAITPAVANFANCH